MIDGEDEAFYETLTPYFYSNKIVNLTDNFFGNSGFIFAKYLCEKHTQYKDQILQIVKPQMKFFSVGKFLNSNGEEENAFEYFSHKLNFSFEKDSEFLDENELLKQEKSDFKHKFTNFKIAVFGAKKYQNVAQNLGGDTINFELENEENMQTINEIYKSDKELAVKLSGEILFDAFDNGADFLLVNSKFAFKFFDENADKIQTVFGRNIVDFYVLKMDEFIDLAKGKKPNSISEHKLKVSLI